MKPWPSDAIALICTKAGDPYWNPIEPSFERNCFNCEQTVMAASSTIHTKTTKASEIVCIECYRLYTDGKPHVLLKSLEA